MILPDADEDAAAIADGAQAVGVVARGAAERGERAGGERRDRTGGLRRGRAGGGSQQREAAGEEGSDAHGCSPVWMGSS